MAVSDIYQAVMQLSKDRVAELVQAELDAGTEVSEILQNGLIAPMDEVGEQFSNGDLFIPEMLRAAQSLKAGLEVLRPVLADTQTKSRGTILISTVKGDLHDIGKNLVSMMLEGAGFTVVDMGVDVAADTMMAAAEKHDADIIALSALLTTTMPEMKSCIDAFNGAGCRGKYKVMVGGAPVTPSFAEDIGADGFAEDAAAAVQLARRLVSA